MCVCAIIFFYSHPHLPPFFSLSIFADFSLTFLMFFPSFLSYLFSCFSPLFLFSPSILSSFPSISTIVCICHTMSCHNFHMVAPISIAFHFVPTTDHSVTLSIHFLLPSLHSDSLLESNQSLEDMQRLRNFESHSVLEAALKEPLEEVLKFLQV